MFGKVTEREKQLAMKIKMLQEENTVLRNHNSYLAESTKRWARKFHDPKYSVPAKLIEKMEQEAEEFKEKARAERDELKARVAILTNRVIELTAEKADDLFGSATGNTEISYELAANHADAMLTKQDHNVVHLQLTKAWSDRMLQFAS